MQVDENDFFRKATLRICSSLDIEIAMWRSIQFLREFIPVDMMFLHLYERDLGAMRTIAMATVSEGRKVDQITPLPKEARFALENNYRNVQIVNQPELEPVTRAMVQHLGKPDASVVILLLEVEGQKLGGALSMVAAGKGNTQAPNENELHAFNLFIGNLSTLAVDLLAGRRVKPKPLEAKFVDRLLRTLPRAVARRVMGDKYVDEQQCRACGACSRVCPYKAIEMCEKPVFDKARCYACWACYNHCPRHAIYTRKYRGIGHYPKPINELKAKLKI